MLRWSVSISETHRFLIVVEDGRTEERFALGEDFIGEGTVVRVRLVIERRELRRRRRDDVGGGGGSERGKARA